MSTHKVEMGNSKKNFWSSLDLETVGGFLTIISGMLGVAFANSSFHDTYHNLIFFKIYSDFSIKDFTSEVLMVIFFLNVGIELKKEMCEGVLKNRKSILLPFVTAFGGMLIPVSIYLIINHDIPENYPGFAVPCATDIAFAIAIFNLFGRKAPISIKILLLSIAIFDDLGAIIIIALFYTKSFYPIYLIPVTVCIFGLIIMMLRRVCSIKIYVVMLFILAYFLHVAGVHTTIAGVIVGLSIPFSNKKTDGFSPAKKLGEFIHPYVSLAVLPIFAFTACDISMNGFNVHDMLNPVAFGVFLGLFLGKQIGIFGFGYLFLRLKLAPMPHDAKLSDVYSISILGGIGFTMSLFIGDLAFPQSSNLVKIGLLSASCLSAIYGAILFQFLHSKE